jgi:hypothetical protein
VVVTIGPSNPFASRCVCPGAVPFFFPPGQGVADLVERLRTFGWRGQIVGGHGTGKSTLLAVLLPELRRAGREPVVMTLHGGRRTVSAEEWRALRLAEESCPGVQVVVDGFERLSRWRRFRLRWRCRRRGHGLLVTAHDDIGLPDLYRTEVTAELAGRVLDHLLPGPRRSISETDLAERLTRHAGNLREALFDLYDLFEQRHRSAVESS